MVDVSRSGKTVIINDAEIEMPATVPKAVSVDDTVLVLCDDGEPGPRNLVAFDAEGNRLWRIQPLKEVSRPVRE